MTSILTLFGWDNNKNTLLYLNVHQSKMMRLFIYVYLAACI